MNTMTSKHKSKMDNSAAVDTFMRELRHPHLALIPPLRNLFLSMSDEIEEGIKWNAPSFRTHEYFATLNLREKKGLGIILHLGAKVKELPTTGVQIDDPDHLLTWLAADRASIVLSDLEDLNNKHVAIARVLQQWLLYV